MRNSSRTIQQSTGCLLVAQGTSSESTLSRFNTQHLLRNPLSLARSNHGPALDLPPAPQLPQHLQQDEDCEDAGRQARVPVRQEAVVPDCVRRVRSQAQRTPPEEAHRPVQQAPVEEEQDCAPRVRRPPVARRGPREDRPRLPD